jgi:5-methylcytosine-specific restriction endonuclease McrA
MRTASSRPSTPEQRAKRAAYRQANLERLRERERKYQAAYRAAHPERVLEWSRKWWAAHPEAVARYAPGKKAWTAANRPKVNASNRRWKARNPAKVLSNCRLRQTRLAKALCSCCVPGDFEKVYVAARLAGMQVDHVRPLSKGGLHCVKNLQLLTAQANMSKGNRWRPAA